MSPALLELLLCVGIAIFFSLARTFSDNLAAGARGRALGWLLLANGFMGAAGGLLPPLLRDILNPNLSRGYVFVGAALIGWIGLGETMRYLETKAKGRLNAYVSQNPGGSSSDLQPSGSGPLQEDQPPPG